MIAQLEQLILEGRRIERMANPSQRRRRYLAWRTQARAVLREVATPPRLSWRFEALSQDVSIIAGVLHLAPSPEGTKVCSASAEPIPPEAGVEADVFVVHGRDETARDAMFAFLRSVGLRAVGFAEVLAGIRDCSPFTGQVLEQAFDSVKAVVVVLTPDDEARLRPPLLTPDDPAYESRLTPQPRPNVIFEAGMAFGRHPRKTILVEVGRNLRPFSDITGRHVIRMDGSEKRRRELLDQLRKIDCPVQESDRAWLHAGDFSAARTPPLAKRPGGRTAPAVTPSHC